MQQQDQSQQQQNYCNIHPKRRMEFVCLRQNCAQRFFCNECFRGDIHSKHIEQTHMLDDIINCDDEYDLTNSFFKLGDQIDQSEILQYFIKFKENINLQLDAIQKSIISKLQNFKLIQNQAKDAAQQFQETIQKFTQNLLNINNASQSTENLIKQIKQTRIEQNYLISHNKEMEMLQELIMDVFKKVEQSYIVEGKIIFPQIANIVEQNSQLVIQYQGDKLMIKGKQSQQVQVDHKFRLNILRDKTYCIDFSIYRNGNYTPTLKFISDNKKSFDINFSQDDQSNGMNQFSTGSMNNQRNQNLWSSVKTPTESQIQIKNNFNLQQLKNDFQLKFCQQKQQFILYEVQSKTTFQYTLKEQLDQTQNMYFTFDIQSQNKQQQQQLSGGLFQSYQQQQYYELQDENLIQILDFNKIYYY